MKFRNLDSKQSFAQQYKTTLAAFSSELINLILSLVAAFSATTLYVWTDTIQSFVATLQPFLVVLVLRDLISDHMEDKYNYGTERIECISGVASNVLNIVCLAIVFFVAIYNIVNPTQPSATIAGFLILKIINCVVDALLIVEQRKINRNNHGAINASALRLYQQNLYYDLVILIIGIPCFFFRHMRWSWYLSPIASIVICIYFVVKCTKQTIRYIKELSDISIPITEQMRIFDIVLIKGHNRIKSINSVNTHTFNDTVYVDIDVDFIDSTSCAEEEAWLGEVGAEILKDSDARYKISLVHLMKN